MNPPRMTKHMLIVMTLLAVLLRIGTALYLGDRVEPVAGAHDQVSYDALAQRLLEGHGFSFPMAWYPFAQADRPTAHWSYLYTLYLAGIYAVFGHHPLAARLLQAIAAGVHVWLAYRLAYRLFEKETRREGEGETGSKKEQRHPLSPCHPVTPSPCHSVAALSAAALTAVYAYFIFFNAALMTQTFYIIAVLLALNLAVDIAQSTFRHSSFVTRHSPLAMRRWIFLGLALGIGALLRQTLLLFAPILLAWLWWQGLGAGGRELGVGGQGLGTGGRRSAVGGRPSFVIRHSPFVIRHSPFIVGPLVTIAVIALLVLPWTLYNYAAFGDFLLLNSNGGYWFWASNHPSRGVYFDGNYAPAIPEELHGLSEPALDRELYRRGLEFILADPLRFLRLSLSRIGGYFWLLPSVQSSLLSNLGRVLSFTIFLPFMLYGLWLSRRRWRTCLPLYLYIAFDTTLHLISWAAPRYRLPSDALLLVFAGLAVADVISWAGRRVQFAACSGLR